MSSEVLTKLRYRYFPDHLLGEILSKRWIDNVPALLWLVIVLVIFGSIIPNFFLPSNLIDTSRQLGEVGLVVLAMTVTILCGGIDLSVGSIFGLANITMLVFVNIFAWPLYVAIPATLALTSAIGLANGFLVGYMKLRAFLTTLVTLIIVRAVVDMLLLKYAQPVSAAYFDSAVWDFMGDGTVLELPFSLIVYLIVAFVLHVILSRTRP